MDLKWRVTFFLSSVTLTWKRLWKWSFSGQTVYKSCHTSKKKRVYDESPALQGRFWAFFFNWIHRRLAACTHGSHNGSSVMCGFCGFCGHLVGWWNTSTHRWNRVFLPARQFYAFSIVESLPAWKKKRSLKSNLKKTQMSSIIKWNCRKQQGLKDITKRSVDCRHPAFVTPLFYFFTIFFSEIGDQIKLTSNTQFLRTVCLCRTRPCVLLDIFFVVFDQPAQTADFFLLLFFPLLRLFSVTSAAGSRFCWVCGFCGRMGGCTCSFLG